MPRFDRKKFKFQKLMLLVSVVLILIVVSLLPDRAYAPENFKLSTELNLEDSCYRITQIMPGFNGEYKVGISSRKKCFSEDNLKNKIPIIISTFATPFDQTYVDFYSIREGKNPEFLYSEISGNVTRNGLIFGLTFLVILGMAIFYTYQKAQDMKLLDNKKSLLLKGISLILFLLMIEVVVLTFNTNRLKITDLIRENMPLITE